MTQLIGTRGLHRPSRLGIALGLIAAAIAVAPAAAARPVVTRVVNIGFHIEQHFDADPSCGPFAIGVTEIADGNSHLVIVDDGTRLAITSARPSGSRRSRTIRRSPPTPDRGRTRGTS